MITKSLEILNSMRYSNGLFAASKKDVTTGYNLTWIRDNIYAILGFEAVNRFDDVKKTLRSLLDIFHKHAYKIDWMIRQPYPKERFRYIHARYNPHTGEEIWDDWGDKQNDAVGAFLFKVGQLENKGIRIIRNSSDILLIQKLVYYLASIEYWHDSDNGIWENEEEIHASSIGACVAGLKEVSKFVDVPPLLISRGETALKNLLPYESKNKKVDLALLSLIYPYNIVSSEYREEILKNVEFHLVREKGVIRYFGDWYYSRENVEAQWVFGLVWLSIIYKKMNVPHKFAFYMRKTVDAMNSKGEIPELYIAGKTPNENTPLAWAQSLWVVANSI